MPSFSVEIAPFQRQQITTQEKTFILPHWNCFCCKDTGTVSSHLLNLVCPGYSIHTHPLVHCKNCVLDNPISQVCAQNLLDKWQCKELDEIARQDWRDTAKEWQQFQAKLQEATNAIASYTGKSGDQVPRIENIEKAKQEFDF